MKKKGPTEFLMGILAHKELIRALMNRSALVENFVRKAKRIEPVFFLNASINTLYERVKFSPELLDVLLNMGVANMNELKDCVNNKDPRLNVFDMDLRKEVNDLFFRARVPLKENW